VSYVRLPTREINKELTICKEIVDAGADLKRAPRAPAPTFILKK